MPKIVKDEDVFQAVIRVTIERGYHGATTKQMAKAAGVSEVTLFRKYGSKAQLIKLAIRAIADQMDFESVTQYSGDVYRDLLGIVARYQRLTAQYGQFLAMMIPEMRRHPELAEALDRPMGIMHTIGRLLVRYQEEGVLQPEPPLHAVAALLGPLIYFAMIRGTAYAGQIPTIDLEQHVTHFLEGRRTMTSENARLIHYEITVNGALEEVWDAWTTERGVQSFFAPACNIDLRIDGLYEILFFPDAEPGFRGAEGTRIMAIEPYKLFSFTWNQTPDLTIRPQRTLVTLKFRRLGDRQTQLIFLQTGWGDGPEWDKAYAYFQTAWRDVVLYRLQHRFDHGPVDWQDPPRRSTQTD